MTEQTRTFFRQMYAESKRFQQEKDEREKEKEALIAGGEWDKVQAWYDREEQFQNPYTRGQYKAYWAYRGSSKIETGDFEMNDFLWDTEVKDFSDTLKAAGITTFVLTNQSTALMENIHQLEGEGWKLQGICKLPVKEYHFSADRIVDRLGLRFEIEKEA